MAKEKDNVIQNVLGFIKKHKIFILILIFALVLGMSYKTIMGINKMQTDMLVKEAKEAAYKEGYSKGEEDGINEQKENSIETTKLDFESLGLLVTQESNMTIVNNYKADKKVKVFSIEFSQPFSNVQQIYSYDVQICAGIDFTKVEYEIDESTKTIQVKLPEVVTISKALDNDSFQLYYEKESAFKKVTITEFNDQQGSLVDQAEETAIAKGLYDNALVNAKLIIKNIIYQFSAYSDYTVTFK